MSLQGRQFFFFFFGGGGGEIINHANLWMICPCVCQQIFYHIKNEKKKKMKLKTIKYVTEIITLK